MGRQHRDAGHHAEVQAGGARFVCDGGGGLGGGGGEWVEAVDTDVDAGHSYGILASLGDGRRW